MPCQFLIIIVSIISINVDLLKIIFAHSSCININQQITVFIYCIYNSSSVLDFM